jgi:hypothetical protein
MSKLLMIHLPVKTYQSYGNITNSSTPIYLSASWQGMHAASRLNHPTLQLQLQQPQATRH